MKYLLPESIVAIAESQTVEMLGKTCHRAIAGISGSPAVALYLLNGDQPDLLYSRCAPEGFLEDYYRCGLAKADPFVECILDDGRVLDGVSLYGSRQWPRTNSYDLLRSWGFHHNMCGPLRYEDNVVGVIYTAKCDDDAPYSSQMKQQMSLLCRAGSIALASLMRDGRLDGGSSKDSAKEGELLRVMAGSPFGLELPPRSAQVAHLICKGATNKTIGRQMGISDQTVKEHVTNLCRRLGARNRTELAVLLLGNIGP